MFACCLGFLAFYLLEQATHNDADQHSLEPSRMAGLWGATGITVHSFLDGVAIGEGFRAGAGVGWIVALAVVVHKFADGVSTIGILMTTGRSARVAKVMLAITAFEPLVGLAVQSIVLLPLYMLAFALG